MKKQKLITYKNAIVNRSHNKRLTILKNTITKEPGIAVFFERSLTKAELKMIAKRKNIASCDCIVQRSKMTTEIHLSIESMENLITAYLIYKKQ